MRIERLGIGSHKGTNLDIRTIVGSALALGATGVILVHNHPSGIPRPSTGDLTITRHLNRVLAELDIKLLDHLIVARGRLGTIQDFWMDARGSERRTDNDTDSTEPFMLARRDQRPDQ